MARDPTIIEHSTFHYRFQFCDGAPGVSVWMLTFYLGITFLAVTVPDDLSPLDGPESRP